MTWSGLIARHATRQGDRQKWSKPEKLPLTADTVKMNLYLSKAEADTKAAIKAEGINITLWRQLAQIALTQTIMFNRRRPSETQFLEVNDFLKQMASSTSHNDDFP